MNIKEIILFTLKQAACELSELKDDCFVIGSAALILSDIPIEYTKDIDLLVSVRDAELLKKLWKDKDQHIGSEASDNFRSNLSLFGFQYIDIEVSGGLEIYNNNEWQPLIIENRVSLSIDGFDIYLPTLEDQKKILMQFGRKKDFDKLKLIDRFLNNRYYYD